MPLEEAQSEERAGVQVPGRGQKEQRNPQDARTGAASQVQASGQTKKLSAGAGGWEKWRALVTRKRAWPGKKCGNVGAHWDVKKTGGVAENATERDGKDKQGDEAVEKGRSKPYKNESEAAIAVDRATDE